MLETSGSGTMLASYVLGETELVSQTRAAVTSYYLRDGQGSTRALTNSAGAVTDTYAYTAFGEPFSRTGTTVNPYQYTGQQFDPLTGLYSLRARTYAPGLGRFLTQDTYPVDPGNPVELNRYVYTANDPVNLVDPTGRDSTTEYPMPLLVIPRIGGPALSKIAAYAFGGLALAAVALLFAQEVVDAPPETNALEWLYNLGVRQSNMCPPENEPGGGGGCSGWAAAVAIVLYLILTSSETPTQTVPTEKPDIAYRNPNPSQHPKALLEGFYPKDPSAHFTVEYHVRYGSRPRVRTQYISLTRSLSVALAKQTPGLPIYIIDLNKVYGEVYDLTNEAVLLALIQDPIARNYARASAEIVVDGWIPPVAIIKTIP